MNDFMKRRAPTPRDQMHFVETALVREMGGALTDDLYMRLYRVLYVGIRPWVGGSIRDELGGAPESDAGFY